MSKHRSLPVVVLGLTLGATGCAGGAKQSDPPEPVIIGNPPAPEPEPEPVAPTNPPAMPTWDEVPSRHPPGATNPPMPVLLVSPEGRCFKQWVSPMVPPPAHRDRIEACDEPEACGTEVVCPAERAAPLLEQIRAGKDAEGE